MYNHLNNALQNTYSRTMSLYNITKTNDNRIIYEKTTNKRNLIKDKINETPPPPKKKNITRIVFYDVNNNDFFKSKNSTE